MRNMPTLWARELGVWFHSGTTYVMLAVFSAVTGLIVWRLSGDSVGNPFDPALLVFGPLYFWLMIVVLVSVIAMRLFVEDRRSGMLEMILTAPVTEWEIVLAKYAAAMTVFAVACLPLPVYPLLLSILREPATTGGGFDPIPLVVGFFALFVCGAFFNGIGVLCAAVLRGPVATIIAVFVVCSLLFVIDQAVAAADVPRLAATLQAVALAPSIRDFSRGIVDTRPLILWLTIPAFCLFSAQRALRLHRVTRKG